MNRLLRFAWRSVVSYVLAGAACLLYQVWPLGEGHAHIPMSGFPEVLVWSPLAPWLALTQFLAAPQGAYPALLVFASSFCALWWCFKPCASILED